MPRKNAKRDGQSARELPDDKPFAVVDCETDPFKVGRIPAPFVWGFYDGSEYLVFDSTDDMVQHLMQFNGVVYAHNGGKFDWHFIKDYFDPGTNLMLINGRIAKVKLGDAELRDSWNILPVPLAAYQKDEIDYAIMEPGERDKPENRAAILDYLRGDCVYLWNLISAFRARHGTVLTQATAAMKSWQRKTDSDAPRSTREYYDMFRPFYYGGRVQCFETGVKREPFEVFDINSAYPFAMLSPHPASLTFFRGAPDDLELFVNENPTCCVRLSCVSKGHLPWREAPGKKIHYPSDNKVRYYHVTGHELIVAFKHKLIDKINNVRVFYWRDLADFKDFILPLYNERLEAKAAGNKAADILAKLEMNSLYGKFGSDPRKYKAYKLFAPEQLADLLIGDVPGENRPFALSGEFGRLLLGEAPLSAPEERFYNVATSLSITGYVRAYLADAMAGCERVLYCDTDSLAVVGGHRLEIGKELGQWESEGEFSQWAIAGRKLYAFQRPDGDWKVRSKGVRLNEDEIMEVAKGGTVEYEFEAPTFGAKKQPYFTSRKIRAEMH